METDDMRSKNLDRLEELARQDHHLAVLVTLNEDGSPQVSVVNCGIVDDPGSHEPVVALVARPVGQTSDGGSEGTAQANPEHNNSWLSRRGLRVEMRRWRTVSPSRP